MGETSPLPWTTFPTCQLVTVFRLADRFSEQPTDHSAQIAKQLETGPDLLGHPRQGRVRPSILRLHVTLKIPGEEFHAVDRPGNSPVHSQWNICKSYRCFNLVARLNQLL